MANKKNGAAQTAQNNESNNSAKFAQVFNKAKTAEEGKKILDYMIAGFTAAFNAKFAPKQTPAKAKGEPAKTKSVPTPSKQEIADAVPEAQNELAKAEVTPIKESDKKAIKKLHLEFHDYSEKSFAIVGDTKPIKAICEKYKGRFNRYLSVGAGWIFAKKYEADVKAALCLQ
jgi:hypothetical protein